MITMDANLAAPGSHTQTKVCWVLEQAKQEEKAAHRRRQLQVIWPNNDTQERLQLGLATPKQRLIIPLVLAVFLRRPWRKDGVGVVPAHTAISLACTSSGKPSQAKGKASEPNTLLSQGTCATCMDASGQPSR